MQRYRKDDLSVERKKRLDRIEFCLELARLCLGTGFCSIVEIQAAEGRLSCTEQHREGHYKLGSWVSVQRRKKNVMPPKRQ